MRDTRQDLIEIGWRQGRILQPEAISGDGAIAYLVLTQTCDCINPNFEKEPYLELLPLHPVEGKPDKQKLNGRNPREIFFQVLCNGNDIWVRSKISELRLHDRKNHGALKFHEELSVDNFRLDAVLVWRAARYLRPAFPDTFENAFREISAEFGKLVKKNESLIDSLLISIEPSGELEEGDCYELQLLIMAEPTTFGQAENVRTLKKVTQKIGKVFEKCPTFGRAICKLEDLDEMTLWKRRKYQDFSRYDYLSFGEDR